MTPLELSKSLLQLHRRIYDADGIADFLLQQHANELLHAAMEIREILAVVHPSLAQDIELLSALCSVIKKLGELSACVRRIRVHDAWLYAFRVDIGRIVTSSEPMRSAYDREAVESAVYEFPNIIDQADSSGGGIARVAFRGEDLLFDEHRASLTRALSILIPFAARSGIDPAPLLALLDCDNFADHAAAVDSAMVQVRACWKAALPDQPDPISFRSEMNKETAGRADDPGECPVELSEGDAALNGATESPDSEASRAAVVINLKRCAIIYSGREIPVRPVSLLKLLELLIHRPGEIVSYTELESAADYQSIAPGVQVTSASPELKQLIFSLRGVLRKNGILLSIKAIRNLGYMLTASDDK